MELIKGEKVKTENNYHWIKIDCPICNIPPTKFLGNRGGTAHRSNQGVQAEIWQCEKCSLIFANPMPVPVNGLNQHYSVNADEYFAVHNPETKLNNAREMLRQTELLLGRKGKILDIGTGRGEIVFCAKEGGWEVVGVEPSESHATYTEKFTGEKIWRKTVEECKFPNDEFDIVVLAAVLEHLYNPDEVVGEISRILKKGGLFYFDVPNEKGLFFKVGNVYQKLRRTGWNVNLSPTFKPFHVFGFSPKSVKMLLNKHNMSVKKWRIYDVTALTPEGGGIRSKIESQAAKLITVLSSSGNLGSYIEAWAEKK